MVVAAGSDGVPASQLTGLGSGGSEMVAAVTESNSAPTSQPASRSGRRWCYSDSGGVVVAVAVGSDGTHASQPANKSGPWWWWGDGGSGGQQ